MGFADLRGRGLGKKERAGVLEVEGLIPQCTLCIMTFCHDILPIQAREEKPSYEAKWN